MLFTDNETNNNRIYGTDNPGHYVKDGINDYVIHGRESAVNPADIGTKAAAHHILHVKAGGSVVVRLRLMEADGTPSIDSFTGYDRIFEQRVQEADEFYRTIIPPKTTEDEGRVMRQALAGMLWSKQYFLFRAR